MLPISVVVQMEAQPARAAQQIRPIQQIQPALHPIRLTRAAAPPLALLVLALAMAQVIA